MHPDDVVGYISPGECQVSYNPLQMALLWNSLATREVNLLQHALEHRHALPPHTAWVNYVRSHDDIGWTFADEDAAHFGIDGFAHTEAKLFVDETAFFGVRIPQAMPTTLGQQARIVPIFHQPVFPFVYPYR